VRARARRGARAAERGRRAAQVRGSSSSDGRHVCQGQAQSKALGCRGIAWSIYLDGGYSGAHIHGNILDGSSKGAVIIGLRRIATLHYRPSTLYEYH
jgi:hypothetical protein